MCHEGDDDEILSEREEESNGPLGGEWYLFEEGVNPRSFLFDEVYLADLLNDKRNWCDTASLEDGCFLVFWGINNTGGLCLFVADKLVGSGRVEGEA